MRKIKSNIKSKLLLKAEKVGDKILINAPAMPITDLFEIGYQVFNIAKNSFEQLGDKPTKDVTLKEFMLTCINAQLKEKEEPTEDKK